MNRRFFSLSVFCARSLYSQNYFERVLTVIWFTAVENTGALKSPS